MRLEAGGGGREADRGPEKAKLFRGVCVWVWGVVVVPGCSCPKGEAGIAVWALPLPQDSLIWIGGGLV